MARTVRKEELKCKTGTFMPAALTLRTHIFATQGHFSFCVAEEGREINMTATGISK